MSIRKRPIGKSTVLALAGTALSLMILSSCVHHRQHTSPDADVMQAEITESGTTETSEMSGEAHLHHSIDYIEIYVTDMAEAQRFYGAAFDWKFTDYGPDYAGIQKEGGEAGGLALVESVSTGGPLIVLHSKDLEATFAGVKAAGGTITKEIFEFPGGRRFQFKDPSGNELGVWAF